MKNHKLAPFFTMLMFFLFFSDLSDCQLMQVPDAIYFMMKNTKLTACNLSSNVLTKIPPKFPAKFSLITGKFHNQPKKTGNPEVNFTCSYSYIPYGTIDTKPDPKFDSKLYPKTRSELIVSNPTITRLSFT